MTREEFNNNSYLVNNNALYNKHTEHISTTEPLYLDGMPGSDNIVHEDREKLRRAFEWIDTLLRILNKGLADLYGPAKLGTMKLNSTYSQCLIVFQGSDVNRWIPVLLNSYIVSDLNGDSCLEAIDVDSLPEEYDDIALQAMQEDSIYIDGEIVDMPTLDHSLILSAMQILWNEESLAELGINSEEDLLKLPILNIPVSELSRHPEFILAERVPHDDTTQKTYWKKTVGTLMVAGFIMSNKVYIYGEDETNINHYDDNGSYWEFINMGQEGLQNVLDSINNHYGKEYNTITIMSGPMMDVENWDAYEKIEIPTLYFKTNNAQDYYLAQVKGSQCFALGNKELQTVNRVNSEGICLSSFGGTGIVEGLWKNKLQAAGYDITGGEIIDSGLVEGDVVQDFNKYIEI